MAKSHSLGQDNQIEMQHDIFGHVMPLAPPLNDAMASSVTPLHSLGQDDQNKVKHHVFGQVTTLVLKLVSNDVNGVIKGTTVFLR